MNQLIFILILSIFSISTTQATPLIKTDTGRIKGITKDSLNIYLGIPYAKAPVADLRWKPPQPIEPSTQIINATKYSSMCAQANILTKQFNGQEDCLYLNIWTPENVSPNSDLPVMVFIHGGGFTMGSADQSGAGGQLYDGSSIVKNQNIVFVNFNYRLGALGFFAHPDLEKESEFNSSGNYGLMDMIAALKWVKENISAFGGNPNKIFLFGQSAGAISTCALLASPEAKGLFNSAGLQSAFCNFPTAQYRKNQGVEFTKKFNCEKENPIECMRLVKAEDIISSAGGFIPDDMSNPAKNYYKIPWGPNIDGYIIPDAPLKLFKTVSEQSIPLLIGSTTDEAGIFTNPIKIQTCYAYRKQLRKEHGVNANAIESVYPCTLLDNPNKLLTQIASDVTFTCPTRRIARVYSEFHPTYRYAFNYAPFGLMLPIGAYHMTDVLLVLNTYKYMFNMPTYWSYNLSQLMQSYWTNMTTLNKPARVDKLTWPLYENSQEKVMYFDSNTKVVKNYRKKECDLWDKLYNK